MPTGAICPEFSTASAPFRHGGFLPRDLLPLIPPGAKLYSNTKVDPRSVGKVPGRYLGNGIWSGLTGSWPSDGLTEKDQMDAAKWPTRNVGLRGAEFPAIDIDTESEEARAMVEAVLARTLPESAIAPVRTRSNAPRALYVFRSLSPFSKHRIEFKTTPDQEKPHAVEVLGQGQQHVVAGTHPTGVDYEWRDGKTPVADKLPVMSVEGVTTLMSALTAEIEKRGWFVTSEAKGGAWRREKAVDHRTIDPVMSVSDVLAALQTLANTPETRPDRNDLVKIFSSVKLAAGRDADKIKADVLVWATAHGWAEWGYAETIWDSLTQCEVPASYLFNEARKRGWKSVIHKAPTGFDFPQLHALKDAERIASEAIETFLRRGLKFKDGVPYQAGVVVSPGVGKTELVLRALAKKHKILFKKRILLFVPDNELAAGVYDRAEKIFADTGVHVRRHRGRINARTGEALCHKSMHGRTAEIEDMGGSVAELVCPTCPFHDTCDWIKQNADNGPGLVILPHAYLTLPKVEKCDLAIIDEQFLLGLKQRREVDFARLTDTNVTLPDTVKDWQDSEQREADERALRRARERLFNAFQGGKHKPTITELHEAGLSHEIAKTMEAIEYKRWGALEQILKEENARCKTTAELQRAMKEPRELYGDAEAMAKVWKSIKQQLKCSERENLNGFYLSEKVTEGGEARTMLTVHLRKDLKKAIREKPILALDATGDKRLLELALPHLDHVDTAYVDAKHATVIQVVNARNPKSKLVDNPHDDQKTKDAKARRREPIFDLADAMGRGTGVISYKGVYDSEQAADARTRHKLGYYNLLRGQNIWKDVRTLVVAGRNMPSPLELETLAGGLFYDQPESITQGGKVEFRTGWHRMRDGSYALGEGEYHPDSTIELVRRQITEAELVQAIGRARGVRRGENNPVCILVLTTTPMSEILIDKLVTAEELMTSLLEVNFGRTGVHLATPAHAARAFPEAFGNVEAARKVFQKYDKWENPLIDTLYKRVFPLIENKPPTSAKGESGALVRVSYKLAGKKQRPSSAVFDTRVVPNPRLWLEKNLGPLAKFETDTPAPVTRLYVSANDNWAEAFHQCYGTAAKRPVPELKASPAVERWLRAVASVASTVVF